MKRNRKLNLNPASNLINHQNIDLPDSADEPDPANFSLLFKKNLNVLAGSRLKATQNLDFENSLRTTLKSDDNASTSGMVPADVTLLLAQIQPVINRKSRELREKKRLRQEMLQLITGYIIFMICAPLIIFDFIVNGFKGVFIWVVLTASIISIIALCSLPVFVRFMKDIN